MSVGVTGVNIAPEIGLHFHEGSLSFVEKICCCTGCSAAPELPKLNEQMYIDRKMRLRRWQDAKCEPSMAATHARLKLMVIERFESVSDSI